MKKIVAFVALAAAASHAAYPERWVGDITGSWNFVPKDILMVVWENGHGPVAMKHFADNGFRTLAGIYYDHSDLENDRKWLKECNRTKGCQGLMYTTWQRKYGLLEDFAEMVKSGR